MRNTRGRENSDKKLTCHFLRYRRLFRKENGQPTGSHTYSSRSGSSNIFEKRERARWHSRYCPVFGLFLPYFVSSLCASYLEFRNRKLSLAVASPPRLDGFFLSFCIVNPFRGRCPQPVILERFGLSSCLRFPVSCLSVFVAVALSYWRRY